MSKQEHGADAITPQEIIEAQAKSIKEHVKEEGRLNRIITALRQQVLKLGGKPTGEQK